MSNLNFVEAGKSASGKTKIWRVAAVMNPLNLGEISWFAHWRKYVFAPFTHMVFDHSCLREIADFCERVTAKHKLGVKEDDSVR